MSVIKVLTFGLLVYLNFSACGDGDINKTSPQPSPEAHIQKEPKTSDIKPEPTHLVNQPVNQPVPQVPVSDLQNQPVNQPVPQVPISNLIPVRVEGAGIFDQVKESLFPTAEFDVNPAGKKFNVSLVFFTFHSRMDPADVASQLKKLNIDTPFVILGLLMGQGGVYNIPALITQVENITGKQVLKLKKDEAFVTDFRAKIDLTNPGMEILNEQIIPEIKDLSRALEPLQSSNLSPSKFIDAMKQDPKLLKLLDLP